MVSEMVGGRRGEPVVERRDGFYKDENGGAFHTYSSYAFNGDILLDAHNHLDLSPAPLCSTEPVHTRAGYNHPSNTTLPPVIVASTFTSNSASGSTANGSSDNTAKSPSLPAVSEPLSCSSKAP